MIKQQPLWRRMYFDPVYTEVVRAVGYAGVTYRELCDVIEDLGTRFGKTRVESATYHLVTFEGQMTSNPKPLTHVALRAEARKLAWQLLGPPPERRHAVAGAADATPENNGAPRKKRTPKKGERDAR